MSRRVVLQFLTGALLVLVLGRPTVSSGQEPSTDSQTKPAKRAQAAPKHYFSGVMVGTDAGTIRFEQKKRVVKGTLVLGGKHFEVIGDSREDRIMLRGSIDAANQVFLRGVRVQPDSGSQVTMFRGTWKAYLDRQVNRGVWLVHER